MFSIICVYNNTKILNDFLLKSLKNQNSNYELMLVDNRDNKYDSAAEALNYGGSKAKNDLIIFIHQDVSLLSNEWLSRAENILNKVNNLGSAGIAGMKDIKYNLFLKVGYVPCEIGIGSVYHHYDRTPWNCNKTFRHPVVTQTLDEHLLIIPRIVFNKYPFDKKTCDSWHLYAVDYCLSLKNKNLCSYVIPLSTWHLSTGILDQPYYNTLNKIFKKHSSFNKIFTTCGCWYTSLFRNILVLSMMCIKSEISRFMGINKHGSKYYRNQIKNLWPER